jgi:hypothetical protein
MRKLYIKLITLVVISFIIGAPTFASAQVTLTHASTLPITGNTSDFITDSKYSRAYSASTNNNLVYVWNTTNPTAPVLTTTAPTTGLYVQKLAMNGNDDLLATVTGFTNANGQPQDNALDGLYVNKSNITPLGSADPIPTVSASPLDVAVYTPDRIAFVLDYNQGTVEMINALNPASIYPLTSFDLPSPYAVVFKGKYAYISSPSNGTITAVSAVSSNPIIVANTISYSGAASMAINGDYLYVSNGNNQIGVYDISKVTKPAAVGLINLPNKTNPSNLYVSNNELYFSGSIKKSSELYAYNLALTPAQPTLDQAENIATQYVESISSSNNVLYVAEDFAFWDQNANSQVDIYSIAN